MPGYSTTSVARPSFFFRISSVSCAVRDECKSEARPTRHWADTCSPSTARAFLMGSPNTLSVSAHRNSAGRWIFSMSPVGCGTGQARGKVEAEPPRRWNCSQHRMGDESGHEQLRQAKDAVDPRVLGSKWVASRGQSERKRTGDLHQRRVRSDDALRAVLLGDAVTREEDAVPPALGVSRGDRYLRSRVSGSGAQQRRFLRSRGKPRWGCCA